MAYTPEWYEKNKQRLRLKYQEKKHENYFSFSITRGNYIIYFVWIYRAFYFLNNYSGLVQLLKNGLVNMGLKRVLIQTQTQRAKIGGDFDRYNLNNLKSALFVWSIQKMMACDLLWVFWIIDNIRFIPSVKPTTGKIWVHWIWNFEKSCAIVVVDVFICMFCELLH